MKNTINEILNEKIIVIVRAVAKKDIIPFAEAVYRGGIKILECTYDASKKIPDKQIAENIKMLADHFGDKMIIGAGTVLSEEQVRLTKEAGGKFIISPDVNEAIIRKTRDENMVSIPGAFTPSEAIVANKAGADFVKIFPIGSMGPSYLKDIKAPLSHIRFLAVGGINDENMSEYILKGACGVGVGSSITNKKLIEQGNFDAIEELARKYVSARDKNIG